MSRNTHIKKIIDALLHERAPLNYNKGPIVRDARSRHISPKDKRHSGWVTPRWTKGGGMKFREAVQEGLEPQIFYDDWKDWRDGQRNYFDDPTHFKKGKRYENIFVKEWERAEHVNHKLRKQLAIRRARRASLLNKN